MEKKIGKRILEAATRSILRKEIWEKKLKEMGIEYTVENKHVVDTWYEFNIEVNIAGYDLNYMKICNELGILDEMVKFYYRE